MKILKFYADWCMPCKGLTQLILNNKDKIKYPIDNVDIDERQDVAIHYGVRGVPTMILLDENNAEVRRVVGGLTEKQLLEFVK